MKKILKKTAEAAAALGAIWFFVVLPMMLLRDKLGFSLAKAAATVGGVILLLFTLLMIFALCGNHHEDDFDEWGDML